MQVRINRTTFTLYHSPCFEKSEVSDVGRKCSSMTEKRHMSTEMSIHATDAHECVVRIYDCCYYYYRDPPI